MIQDFFENDQNKKSSQLEQNQIKSIKDTMESLRIDKDVCIWSFGDNRSDENENPYFSADPRAMRALSST